MVDPKNNPPAKDSSSEDKDKNESENLFRILDDLLTHTNSSRRLFLIFIACALFFGPVVLVLGGVLLGHPAYNIRHLETQNDDNGSNIPVQGMHLQLVSQNGTILREMPFGDHHRAPPAIFLGVTIFIIISVIVAGILLFIAIKEYRFFSNWNKRFIKYKSLRDKVDKDLGED